MQRLQERQSVLLAVGERLAVCRVAGISGGKAVLMLTERQLGGPMPDEADDAEITFEHGTSLVVLKGGLVRRSSDQLLFSVTDGVQVPPRRRDTRLRITLPVTVRSGDAGRETQTETADLSATGVGVTGSSFGMRGDEVHVVLELPEGGTVTGSGPIVRVAGGTTAIQLSTFGETGRERLESFVLDRQREVVEQAV
jgi:PilZ domain